MPEPRVPPMCAGIQSALRNMPSASKKPEVVEQYIQQEVEIGNILGPFASGTAPMVHINRFGAIPKKYQPGKWRLIMDFSFPEGKIVKDAIDTKLCSLEYITVDNVTDVVMSLGVGALIAKTDIKSAYCLIPVCPADKVCNGKVESTWMVCYHSGYVQCQKYSMMLLMLWNGV